MNKSDIWGLGGLISIIQAIAVTSIFSKTVLMFMGFLMMGGSLVLNHMENEIRKLERHLHEIEFKGLFEALIAINNSLKDLKRGKKR